jgi:small subunit ribosomal protein S16
MLKIRLRRIGKKHEPIFSVVVAEHSKAVKGDFLEKLGNFNAKTGEFKVNKERVEYWQKNGAKLSDTMHNLLIKNGVMKGKAIKKTVEPKKVEEEKPAAAKVIEGEKVEPEKEGETAEEPKVEEKIEAKEPAKE